jgi:RNA polymerase sigma-70 factor (ECF subfamily)
MGRQTTTNEGHVSAEELFREHAAFVARFLFRLGVRPDGIEDAVQEVFLVVHRQGGYRPGAAKPTSYLANLAVHAASAYRRRERVRVAREVDAPVEDVASSQCDAVEVLETNESLRRLQDALDRLEPDLRTALVLVELEGETCASIAAAMNIPVGTVYWRLHQARKKFQRALQTLDAAKRPHRALAVQAASFAGGLRPERKERAGMMVLLMGSPSWMNSEARDLLRLGGARPPVSYAVQEGLARHQQLAASGAPTPSWAQGLGSAAKGAAWAAASTGAVVVGVAVVLLVGAGRHAPAGSAAQATNAAPMRAAGADVPSASEWRPVATPAPLIDTPSVSVEALPTAAPPAVVMRGAASIDAPHASSAPATDDDLLELQQTARAERLLATDPARALALVRAAETRFPNGYMREERSYIEIIALVGMGRLDDARPKIARFLRDYPESAFAQRVREAGAHLDP